MKHMKRNSENTLCMLYLPRVKEWTTSVREIDCVACRKQVRAYLKEQMEALEKQMTAIERDSIWFHTWYDEEGNEV